MTVLLAWKCFGNCTGNENDDADDAGEAGDIAAEVNCLTSLLMPAGWV